MKDKTHFDMFALHSYLRIPTVREGTGNDSNMDIDIFQVTEIFISSNNSTIIFNGNFIVLEISRPNVGKRVTHGVYRAYSKHCSRSWQLWLSQEPIWLWAPGKEPFLNNVLFVVHILRLHIADLLSIVPIETRSP